VGGGPRVKPRRKKSLDMRRKYEKKGREAGGKTITRPVSFEVRTQKSMVKSVHLKGDEPPLWGSGARKENSAERKRIVSTTNYVRHFVRKGRGGESVKGAGEGQKAILTLRMVKGGSFEEGGGKNLLTSALSATGKDIEHRHHEGGAQTGEGGRSSECKENK